MNVSEFKFEFYVYGKFNKTLNRLSNSADPYDNASVCAVRFGSTLFDKLFLSHFGVQGHNSTYELPQAKMVRPGHLLSLIYAFAA